ncbi:hypothetical protein DAPPUDRAFT_104122 [Daphnia pulex]|uniref:Uncharacterized protein n=1 Tax=Daphnia pulex TaxID=6669 RepID=E9GLB2_DAPPU|nr:hypothetical protein DAPPUDRAFT_104122 [Daphnia pulex]|eukprot:EFX79718.1 hypothetical protein DAPPUDRAFT_104122 [Daphnia pulex]
MTNEVAQGFEIPTGYSGFSPVFFQTFSQAEIYEQQSYDSLQNYEWMKRLDGVHEEPNTNVGVDDGRVIEESTLPDSQWVNSWLISELEIGTFRLDGVHEEPNTNVGVDDGRVIEESTLPDSQWVTDAISELLDGLDTEFNVVPGDSSELDLLSIDEWVSQFTSIECGGLNKDSEELDLKPMKPRPGKVWTQAAST